jgi:chromosome segregation ATPase
MGDVFAEKLIEKSSTLELYLMCELLDTQEAFEIANNRVNELAKQLKEVQDQLAKQLKEVQDHFAEQTKCSADALMQASSQILNQEDFIEDIKRINADMRKGFDACIADRDRYLNELHTANKVCLEYFATIEELKQKLELAKNSLISEGNQSRQELDVKQITINRLSGELAEANHKTAVAKKEKDEFAGALTNERSQVNRLNYDLTESRKVVEAQKERIGELVDKVRELRAQNPA